MSWLVRSIANSLLIDGEDDRPTTTTTSSKDGDHNRSQSAQEPEFYGDEEGSDPQTLTEGVKGDLSEFTESLTRQLRDVAFFLAPNPPTPPPPPPRRHRCSTNTESDPSVSDRQQRDSAVSGDGDDRVSNSVCEDSRFGDGDGDGDGVSHSSTFPIDDQNENDQAFVGVTEEVLSFAMNIAHHPETWLDFPLPEEEDSDDFEMSDTQWNHATLVEHLVQRLAALRIELCPIHMSESYFWKVYFLLLHPRLNKHDADLLSTPQIVAARAMWMKELQKLTKPGPDLLEGNSSHTFNTHEDTDTILTEDIPVVKEGLTNISSNQRIIIPQSEDFDEDEDNWVHENSELDGYEGPDIPVVAEDISFSDLEDDDELPIRSNIK